MIPPVLAILIETAETLSYCLVGQVYFLLVPVLRPLSYYPSLVATESCFRYSTIDWSIGKVNLGMKD